MQNSDSLIAIAGLSCSELTEVFELKQKFRAKQIFKWIADGAKAFDEMTNLPEQMRKELSEKAVLRSSTITQPPGFDLRDPAGAVGFLEWLLRELSNQGSPRVRGSCVRYTVLSPPPPVFPMKGPTEQTPRCSRLPPRKRHRRLREPFGFQQAQLPLVFPCCRLYSGKAILSKAAFCAPG